MAKKPAGTPAMTALTRADVEFQAHTYDHDSRVSAQAGFGLEAAAALGVPPERVFRTLVATLDGGLVVGVVPVGAQLDLKALARSLGGSKAAMAEVAAAERSSGYVAGGISPVGQNVQLPTAVDESALAYPTIFVSGGRRGLDVELAPADLVRVTGAVLAPISRW